MDLFPSASSEIATDFTLGPVLATRAYCDPLVMAQQDEFLTKLGASYDFGFSAGDLWVRFAADGQVDRLVFQANDRVRISTPCFTAEVPYAFEGGTLRIDRLGVEAWSCAEDDPTHRLLRDLAWVRRAVVDLEDLRLELLADGGTLVFERVG